MPRKVPTLQDEEGARRGAFGGTPILRPAAASATGLPPLIPTITQEAVAEVEANLRAAKSANTRRVYAAAMRKLVDWIGNHHPEVVRPDREPLEAVLPLHVATLIDFISHVEVSHTDAAGLRGMRPASVGTLATYVAAIRAAHRQLGMPDPTADPVFDESWAGIRHRRGLRQHGKRALRWDLLKRLVDAAGQAAAMGIKPWSDHRILARDRALLLVGFSGAFRRSELVGLRRDDVRLPLGGQDSLILILRTSKTSDEPCEVEIPRRGDLYCPVRAFLGWLDVIADHGSTDLPVDAPSRPLWFGFRSGRALPDGLKAGSVPIIIKRLASQAGLRPEEVAELSSHSLRSGAATSAAEAKVEAREIRSLGRWASYSTVDRYIQTRQRGGDHPIARLE